jgi:hypothetical protein
VSARKAPSGRPSGMMKGMPVDFLVGGTGAPDTPLVCAGAMGLGFGKPTPGASGAASRGGGCQESTLRARNAKFIWLTNAGRRSQVVLEEAAVEGGEEARLLHLAPAGLLLLFVDYLGIILTASKLPERYPWHRSIP